MRLIVFICLFLCGCVSEQKIEKILIEKPEILLKVIKKNPHSMMKAFQEAFSVVQKESAQKKRIEEKKKLEAMYKAPQKPSLGSDEAFRGDRNAPLVVVEYSDFMCYHCSTAYKTVKSLMKRYGEKIVFVYKHLASRAPSSKLASQYFEAIKLQDVTKAYQLHDMIFENQRGLKQGGEAFLQKKAKMLKVDMIKLAVALSSEIVLKKIAQHQAEAARFNIQGTPGFLLNGVTIKGAYPLSHFYEVIGKLKKNKLLPPDFKVE